MTQDQAETIAIDAMGWLVANDELLPVFMGATGSSSEDVRTRIGDADFLISVLDFLLMDDAWIAAFCDAKALAYEMPMIARQSLPGGADVHWT